MAGLGRARADLARGEHRKARDRLKGLVASAPYDDEAGRALFGALPTEPHSRPPWVPGERRRARGVLATLRRRLAGVRAALRWP